MAMTGEKKVRTEKSLLLLVFLFAIFRVPLSFSFRSASLSYPSMVGAIGGLGVLMVGDGPGLPYHSTRVWESYSFV